MKEKGCVHLRGCPDKGLSPNRNQRGRKPSRSPSLPLALSPLLPGHLLKCLALPKVRERLRNVTDKFIHSPPGGIYSVKKPKQMNTAEFPSVQREGAAGRKRSAGLSSAHCIFAFFSPSRDVGAQSWAARTWWTQEPAWAS